MDISQSHLLNWIATSKTTLPPHYYKQLVVLDYAQSFNIKALIETGTYLGDMVDAMTNYFEIIVSIELSPQLHMNATQKFKNFKNVTLLLGDSGILLPDVLNHIKFRCLFWLDGHYSAGVTAKGDVNTPIIKELNSILEHAEDNHVILIDDARLFNGSEDYPTIKELEFLIENHGYSLNVSNDIIRITPTSLSTAHSWF